MAIRHVTGGILQSGGSLVFNDLCCCCEIVLDDYSSDTDANYTDVLGTGATSGGVRSTSDGTFLSVHNTSGTTGHGKVTVDGKVSASTSAFRIVGSYVDSSNYLFAELTVNGASSTLKLWKRVSGSNTQIGSTYTFTGAVDTYYEVTVCWDGNFALSSLNGTVRNAGAFSGSGNKAGYGAALVSGTGTFNDFSFSKHTVDDPTCDECGTLAPCGPNVCSTPPIQVTVVMDGVINDDCIQCDKWNATFVFTSFDQDGLTDNFCHDVQAGPGTACITQTQIDIFFAKRGSNADLELTIGEFSGVTPIWDATYTDTLGSAPIDCTTAGSGTLDFLSQNGTLCDGAPGSASWSIP